MLGKEKYYAILLGFLSISICAVAQISTWKDYAIDQHLTVRFPVKPQELDVPQTMAANNSPNKIEPQALASKAFRAEDAVATYILVSIPLADNNRFTTSPTERETYLKNRGIPLMIAQMHGELLMQKISVRPGLDSFTIKLRVLSSDGSPRVKYVRVLTIERRIYQLYFIPKDNLSEDGAAQRATFFDALTIAPGK